MCSSDLFGSSLALSGTTAVVGAPAHDSGTGAAYVFTSSGSAWSQQAELIGSDSAAGDGFGTSVAVSGTTAVAGAPGHDSSTGAAYVFTRSGTAWSQRAELAASDAAQGGYFGLSVAVSGFTVAVGAFRNTPGTGAVSVFVRSQGTWPQQAELTGSGGAGDYFGLDVALAGSTAVAGAYGASSGTGTAYVFVNL